MPSDRTDTAAEAASAKTMVAIEADGLESAAAYKLISGSVTPRPIAWVSSLNEDASVNLAPFSSYVFLTYDPPKIGISNGPSTAFVKDTLRNIERNGHFVVNSVSPDQLQSMVESSRRYPAGMSEAADLAVALTPSLRIDTPRITDSEIALECVVDQVVEMGDRDAHRLVIGRVVTFQVDERVLQRDRIHAFAPVGRIGGPLYVMPGEIRQVRTTPDDRLP